MFINVCLPVKVWRKAAGIRQDVQDIHGFLPGTISHYVQNMASNPKATPNSTKPSAKDSAVHCCQVYVELFGQIGKIRPLRNKNSILVIFLTLWHFAELLAELGIKSKGGHTNFFWLVHRSQIPQILGLIPQSQVSKFLRCVSDPNCIGLPLIFSLPN